MSDKVPSWAVAPAQAGSWQLTTERTEGMPSESWLIDDKPGSLIGRNGQIVDVVVDHKSSSRVHACIAFDAAGDPYLVDLGSAHGTVLNGRRLAKGGRERVADGDEVHIAACPLPFCVVWRHASVAAAMSQQQPQNNAQSAAAADDRLPQPSKSGSEPEAAQAVGRWDEGNKAATRTTASAAEDGADDSPNDTPGGTTLPAPPPLKPRPRSYRNNKDVAIGSGNRKRRGLPCSSSRSSSSIDDEGIRANEGGSVDRLGSRSHEGGREGAHHVRRSPDGGVIAPCPISSRPGNSPRRDESRLASHSSRSDNDSVHSEGASEGNSGSGKGKHGDSKDATEKGGCADADKQGSRQRGEEEEEAPVARRDRRDSQHYNGSGGTREARDMDRGRNRRGAADIQQIGRAHV